MSLEANKILGAVLLTGVVAMTAGYAARILTGTGGHHGHGEAHGDDHGSGLAKVINIPEVQVAPKDGAATAEVDPPIASLLASATLKKGEAVFKKCKNCHTVNEGGKNGTGPNLYDIVNKPIASADGFSYSKALSAKADMAWTYENLNGFVKKPKEWAKGTKMSFAGLKKIEDRAALIAYLRSLSANPASIEE